MSESKKMNLMNKELYKNKITDDETVIFEYVKILHEYLSHITKNININSMVHNNFIINRGYDLLKNIFLTLILYTKNLELRLLKHNSNKGAKSTKGYKWEIIFKKRFFSKSKAMKYEYLLKKNRKKRLFILKESE